MSLNNKEISLLLDELNLENSYIQEIIEHEYNSFTFKMYSSSAYFVYFEIASQNQRFCKTNIIRKKTKNIQRFGQFLKSKITGFKITKVEQIKGERFFTLTLKKQDVTYYLHFRYFAASNANIILCDENNIILELAKRRPLKNEMVGSFLELPKEKTNLNDFKVREYSTTTFNEYVDLSFSSEDKSNKIDYLLNRFNLKTDKEIAGLKKALDENIKRKEEYSNYNTYTEYGDLLSSYKYMMKDKTDSIKVYAFTGEEVTIALDKKLSSGDNINLYYQKGKRAKRIYINSEEKIIETNSKIEELTKHKDYINTLDDKELLLSLLKDEEKEKEVLKSEIGIKTISHGFELIVGRNNKENDAILRKMAKGLDTWVHARDFPGSYVIIKNKKDKTIPLEVLLDAALLASHFSKAKENSNIDCYYTKVKYLKRVKNSHLVLPYQEKNIRVKLNKDKVKELLNS